MNSIKFKLSGKKKNSNVNKKKTTTTTANLAEILCLNDILL